MKDQNSESNTIINTRNYLLSLLYIQTKELHRLYNSPIEGKKDYYFVKKEWLDNYKSSNNYKETIKNTKSSDIYNNFQDYLVAKKKVAEVLKINEKEIINNIEHFSENNDYLCTKERFQNLCTKISLFRNA